MHGAKTRPAVLQSETEQTGPQQHATTHYPAAQKRRKKNDMMSQEATPPCASVAAALSTALATMRETLGRPLDRYEIFAAMRDLVGMRNWDSMPVAESVGAVRLMWTEADVAARATKYLLVTPEGRCYVEGVTPADPSQAAEYLAIRRRFLDAHPPVEPPLLGSPEALQAQAAYEALTDRIAEGPAGLIPAVNDHEPTMH